jgi:hypothetical protein
MWGWDFLPVDNQAVFRDARRSMGALDELQPVSDRYATLPIERAFDWTAVGRDLGAGEWYLVVFRSIRRDGADEQRLSDFDDRAHAEAASSPGFVHYFKGPMSADGSCLSFCIWNSRAEARAAAARPDHAEAVTLLREMYQIYRLELIRLRGHADGRLEFRPYDRSPMAGPSNHMERQDRTAA